MVKPDAIHCPVESMTRQRPLPSEVPRPLAFEGPIQPTGSFFWAAAVSSTGPRELFVEIDDGVGDRLECSLAVALDDNYNRRVAHLGSRVG